MSRLEELQSLTEIVPLILRQIALQPLDDCETSSREQVGALCAQNAPLSEPQERWVKHAATAHTCSARTHQKCVESNHRIGKKKARLASS
jgi:hypothetical protein